MLNFVKSLGRDEVENKSARLDYLIYELEVRYPQGSVPIRLLNYR